MHLRSAYVAASQVFEMNLLLAFMSRRNQFAEDDATHRKTTNVDYGVLYYFIVSFFHILQDLDEKLQLLLCKGH